MSTLAIVLLVATAAATGVLVYRHRAIVHDSGRLAAALVRHPDVPRPLKWLLAAALLPIPGPFEELAGGLAVLLLLRVRPGLIAGVWGEIRERRG